jgi:hypothetical protein
MGGLRLSLAVDCGPEITYNLMNFRSKNVKNLRAKEDQVNCVKVLVMLDNASDQMAIQIQTELEKLLKALKIPIPGAQFVILYLKSTTMTH